MSEIILYIAASIDGFIAREDGSVDWLEDLPNPNKLDYGYAGFIDGIDTVVMGRKTYEEVLGFDVGWPYADCRSFILTSREDYKVKTENTEVLHQLDPSSIDKLKARSQKNIWLVGGGQVITEFLNRSLIDEMILFIMPVLLGRGIPLFAGHPKEQLFELIKAEPFETGVVSLTYRKQ